VGQITVARDPASNMGCVTALRIFSFPMHAAFELVVGLALIFVPLALALPVAGAMVAILLGAGLTGLALEGASDPGALSLGDHRTFDQVAALVLVGAAAIVAIAGERPAAVLLALAGIAEVVLSLTTRYSGSRG
jgi:hypothetical protein